MFHCYCIMCFKSFLLLFILILSEVNSDCGCSKTRVDRKHTNFIKDAKVNNEPAYQTCAPISKDNISMSIVPAGKYQIGTDQPIFIADHESPVKNVELESFMIDKFEVSNTLFFKFVESTGYITDAEKYGDSFVFEKFLNKEQLSKYYDFRVVGALWWYKIEGASWKQPEGADSSIKDKWDSPVVHVTWDDANAFCKWRGGRLPTEAEWEVACRGGRKGKLFPWGNKLNAKDKQWLNIWQGIFPQHDSAEDGWTGVSPCGSYPANGYGLYDMAGNVWEWTSDLWDKSDIESNARVKKGGSYLCHIDTCYRYRCAARSQNTADSSAGNLGFRCAQDI